MQRIAIYLHGTVDPPDTQRAFRQSRTLGSRVVTLLQEDRVARHRPVFQELEHRLEAGEFDQIAVFPAPPRSPLRSQQAKRSL